MAPRAKLVLDVDPRRKSLWWAFGYILRVPTNVVLIISSALGYYFFAGVRTFGVEYLHERYHASHTSAVWLLAGIGAGALGGVYAGGHLADRLLPRDHLRARVWVAVLAYLASAVLFFLGFLSGVLWLALLLFFFAAAGLGGASPPLDAARLDIMHPSLWGRAESARSVLRTIGEAMAPFVFGIVAGQLFGGGAMGLRDAFLVMLAPLAVAGLVGLIALRTYLRDAATAHEYDDRTKAQRAGG